MLRHVASVLLVVGLLAALLVWRTSRDPGIREAGGGSPYLNTRAGVKYVGDAACARCHAEIAESYRRHPMGRSLSPIEDRSGIEGPEEGIPATFTAQGLEYSVEDKDGRVVHRETRRDAEGRPIARIESEIRYIIGSGKQAFGYLIDRDGFLFESPITFYPRDRHWGLSPGYDIRNHHFTRPILADCLYCHANRVERTTGAVNRYLSPIFRGHAIGCERCHGPGELHIEQPRVVDGIDLTIVNPANLEPTRRDAVCEQCHLIGRRRVVRAGRKSEDYRPGFPFQPFWAVFVPPTDSGDNRFAGQVEQMHESRCFRASRGKLGCISCHDPHVQPAPEARAEYFRDRCLECHADRGCRLPREARLRRDPGDDCTGCHMPASGTSNIAHLAITDHRIRRDIGSKASPPDHGAPTTTALQSLVNFYAPLMEERERLEAERDRGVAFCRDGSEAASMVLPLLEAALSRQPDDAIAWESKGEALRELGRLEEAFAAYKEALARVPDREASLDGAAVCAARTGRLREAVAYWRKAIALDPWRPLYHAALARAAASLGDWATVTESCRQALHLEPFDFDVRKRLVQGLLRQGKIPAAQGEFETLLRLAPEDRAALLRWYGSQLPRR